MRIEYLTVHGIHYRRLRGDCNIEPGEYLVEYIGYHHPSKKEYSNKIAVVEKMAGYVLVNHWNRVDPNNWTYYVDEYSGRYGK